jgi:NAD(P)-dependent dehydrogenase (short-subunit alcohol dehydrogenase family)
MSNPLMPQFADWCSPVHHNPEGPTDPTKITLPQPFVVAILGASRGIGAGAATCYAKAGASGIALLARDVGALKDRQGELENISGGKAKIRVFACDVTKDSDLEQAAEAVKQEFGRLDVLVINAGIAAKLVRGPNGLLDWPKNFVDAPLGEFRRVMDLNTIAPWAACHYFLPLLEETKDGAQSIVLVSSAAAHYMDADLMSATYSLTKFAAVRIVEHVHEAHKANGICAFAIQPGGVKTYGSREVPEGRGWEAREYRCTASRAKLIDHRVDRFGRASWSIFCVAHS